MDDFSLLSLNGEARTWTSLKQAVILCKAQPQDNLTPTGQCHHSAINVL